MATPIRFLSDSLAALLDRLRFRDECGPQMPAPAVLEEPEPFERPEPSLLDTPVMNPPVGVIRRVGVWAGSATIRDPWPNIKDAAALGIDEVHVMVADHSACRDEMAFNARPPKGRRAAAIPDLVEIGCACAKYGVKLGLTTWVMPHTRYVEGLALYLRAAIVALNPVCPLSSIILDAEEPWTQADGRFSRAGAAKRLGDALAGIEPRIGLTGIGYANERALDPLAEITSFSVPQVYATTRNGLDPLTSPRRFAKLWHKKFGHASQAIALAAYRQPPGGMTAALEGVRELAASSQPVRVDEVIYWSLANILASPAKRRFVERIKVG